MQAIGILETFGMVAAVEGADTMLKTSNVTILGKAYSGDGLLSVAVTGDVSAVTSAVEAGSTAVRVLGESHLVARHVIPKPNETIVDINFPLFVEEDTFQTENTGNTDNNENIENNENVDNNKNIDSDSNAVKDQTFIELNRNNTDEIFRNEGLDGVMKFISKLGVIKLRKLARKYEDFELKGREISKATKKEMIREFKTYYQNKS